MLPILGALARIGFQEGEGGNDGTMSDTAESLVRVGVAGALMLSRIACMAFSLNTILIKDAAPSKQALGAMYGLAQSFSSIARAISPAFVSSLFAWSIEKKFLGGNLVWVVMIALACLGVHLSSSVIDGAEQKRLESEE